MPTAPPPDPDPTASGLRQRAEAQLASRPAAAPGDHADTLRLVHSLQVHQIELQMQNEALQQAEQQAREALARLAELHATMEARIVDRTAELLRLREAADTANRAKSVFLANMSHELRTPLNGVLGMLDLALQHAGDPRQGDWLAKARRSAVHLLSVINDVLDISKIEADTLGLANDRFQLDAVVDLLLNLLTPRAVQKGLHLQVDMAPALAGRPLLGDSHRLGQVLLNLVGNALKFTDQGGVRLLVQLRETSAQTVLVHFAVEDTGIGIAPADQGRLFRAFEQLDASSTRSRDGTGLGLAICKRLVQLMGGEIGVTSAPGAGSTFWFTARFGTPVAAPAALPARPQVDALARLQAEFAHARILVAEDNPINQEVIAGLLEATGMQISVAHDGVQAVAQARAQPQDLILMDMQMPGLDGIAATHAIRGIPGRPHLPIIALTAGALDVDRARSLAEGLDDHIAKPVDPDVLYATLLKWLRAQPPRRPSGP